MNSTFARRRRLASDASRGRSLPSPASTIRIARRRGARGGVEDVAETLLLAHVAAVQADELVGRLAEGARVCSRVSSGSVRHVQLRRRTILSRASSTASKYWRKPSAMIATPAARPGDPSSALRRRGDAVAAGRTAQRAAKAHQILEDQPVPGRGS